MNETTAPRKRPDLQLVPGGVPLALTRALAPLAQPVPWTDLVLACWKAAPAAFGLKGLEGQYPDSNRVRYALVSYYGPLRRGWVRRAGRGLYEITQAGRQAAAARGEGD